MTDKAHEKAMNYLRSEEMLSSNLKWNKKLEKAIDIALKEQAKKHNKEISKWKETNEILYNALTDTKLRNVILKNNNKFIIKNQKEFNKAYDKI